MQTARKHSNQAREWRRRFRLRFRAAFASFAALCLAASVLFWMVTRSWFILWLLVPELEGKLGGEVVIADAAYQGDGRIIFTDMKLRARGMAGKPGDIVTIGSAIVTIDSRQLLRGALRISNIEVDRAVVRVSEDSSRSDWLNLWALQPKWGSDPGKPMPPPPRVWIRHAAIEFGRHEEAEFFLHGQRLVAGEMHPTPGSRDLYNFTLNEINERGEVVSDGIFMKGEWNAASNEWTSRIDGLELDDRIYRMCPQMVRALWDQMSLEGKVSSVEVTGRPAQPFMMNVEIDHVALTLPIDTETHWARYREGLVEASSSRPRMHFSHGTIRITNHSLSLENLTGALGSSDTFEQVVTVPYRIDFIMPSLPPLKWEQRDEWIKQLVSTAPFDLKFRMDELSMKRTGDDPTPAVDLPLLVAKILQKFQVTDWVLSTSVDVTRGEPTLNADGTLTAAKPVTKGQAYLHNASGRYQKFPIPLRDVDAYLQFDNDRVVVQYLTGTGSGGAKLRISGEISPPDNDAAVSLRLTGTNVPVDDQLRNALNANEAQAFDMLFNQHAHEAMSAAGVLADDDAIARAAEQLGQAKAELDSLKQDSSLEKSEQFKSVVELEGRIARLQRVVDAGPFQLGGMVNLDLKIEREAGPRRRTNTTGTIAIQSVGFLYEKFPYPLRITSGTLDWQQDRIVILPGPSGQGLTLVTPGGGHGWVSGSLTLPRSTASRKFEPDLNVTIEDDEFNEAVFAAIPLTGAERRALGDAAARWPGETRSQAARLVRGIGLTGAATYSGKIAAQENSDIGYDFTLTLNNCKAAPTLQFAHALGFEKEVWPAGMTLNDVSGSLHITRDRIDVGAISGRTSSGSVTITGQVSMNDGTPQNEFVIDLENQPLQPYVLNMARQSQTEYARGLWGQYLPQGNFNAQITYRSRADAADDVALSVQPKDVSVLVDGQRVVMNHTGGALSIHDSLIGFHDLALDLACQDGTAEGSLLLNGSCLLENNQKSFDIRGALTNGRLESPVVFHLLRQTMGENVVERYGGCKPVGLFDAEFHAASSGPESALDWQCTVSPHLASLNWKRRALLASFTQGQITFKPGSVVLSDVHGQHAEGEFSIDGTVSTETPIDAQLRFSHSGQLQSDFVQAFLPPAVTEVLEGIKFSDSGPTTLTNCRVRLTQVPQDEGSPRWQVAFLGPVHTTAASFEAGVELTEVAGSADIDLLHKPGEPLMLDILIHADSARALGQTMTELEAQALLTDEGTVLQIPSVRANAADGVITAQAWTSLIGPGDYQATVNMVGVPVNRFAIAGAKPSTSEKETGRANDARGEVYATLAMSGVRDDPSSRRGRASVRVLHGRMVNIPMLVQLMQVAQLSMPLGGNLDFADAEMYLEGDRIVFERIVFESTLGNMSMLQLSGEGEMDFDTLELHTRFHNRGAVPLVRDIVGGVSDALYCIEVTGPLGDPKARLVPLPTPN